MFHNLFKFLKLKEFIFAHIYYNNNDQQCIGFAAYSLCPYLFLANKFADKSYGQIL